jgi:hypothetical protein
MGESVSEQTHEKCPECKSLSAEYRCHWPTCVKETHPVYCVNCLREYTTTMCAEQRMMNVEMAEVRFWANAWRLRERRVTEAALARKDADGKEEEDG